MDRRLFIFNPETEYALAAGTRGYTPPASVVAVRQLGALTPVYMASRGDGVLAIDGRDAAVAARPDLAAKAEERGILILDPSDAVDWSRFIADPWGWNPQIRHYLTRTCRGLKGILNEDEVRQIRRLAHRRTTADFLQGLPDVFWQGIMLPEETSETDRVIELNNLHDEIYIKAPWSSSGRGVIRTYGVNDRKIREWVNGIVRSQGSVIVEPAYRRTLDFATEWIVDPEGVRLRGLSVFRTTDRGRYDGNIHGDQDSLRQEITRHTSMFTPELTEAMKKRIEQIIGPYYHGPLGIDMMALSDGSVHPCVEINLRHTMGSVILDPS